jgi:hypothetical protein
MKKFTIIALAMALAAVFAVTASATEWNLYGSARMETFWKSEDLVTDDVFGRGDDSDLTWQFQNNSRVGATVKGDRISGRFEYGARPAVRDSGAITNFANVRRLYGVWDFADNWALKVGKDYTPITFFLSGQVVDADAGLLQIGNAYGARRGLVELDWEAGPGTLKIAGIDPTSNVTIPTFVGDFVVAQDTEQTLPKFEASYEFTMWDMGFHAFGGYQYFKQLVNATNPLTGQVFDIDENISAWLLGVGADMNFGPFFVRPQISYYSNGAAAGWLGTAIPGGGGSTLPIINQDGSVADVDTLMAMLALGFNVNDRLGLEVGAGWLDSDSDGGYTNTAFDIYLNAVFSPYPGVFMVPEVGYRDFGDFEPDVGPEVDLGSQWYAGLKWQIDF